MLAVALTLTLACPFTRVQNASQEPWNEHDRKIFKHVSVRCKELYSDAPCVTFFRKYASQQYTVLCGSSRKPDKHQLP